MNAGDPDDEAAMAYFLPNGIADDSPPKPSRFATSSSSSFGPIGTPSASSSSSFFGSGVNSGSSSPAVQEFAAPSLLRPSVLEHSPFRSTGSPSTGSPHQGNYLLSDLGGEIHEPGRGSSSREFGDRGASGVGDAAGSRAGFGYPGSLRSPSSRMFDRGQDAARSLAFPRPHNYSGTPRSIGGLVHDQDVDAAGDQARPMRTSSSSFDIGTVVTTAGLLYSGDSSSTSPSLSTTPFLGHSSEDPFFGSAPIRNWPPHTASSTQPRKKVLSTPPGLGPPSLGGLDSPLSQLTAETGAIGGAPGGREAQFDAKMDSSSAFDPFKSTSIGGSIGSFGTDSRSLGGNSGRIGSYLSRLNLSSDTFVATSPQRHPEGSLAHGGVSNPDLAELNTQSVKMDDLARSSGMPSDSSPTRSPRQDTSSARRIEVQAKPKTGRSSQQPARERRRTETSLEIRGGSPLPLPKSSAGTADSPLRVQTSMDHRPAAPSPSPSQGSSSSDVGAPSGETQSTESTSASKSRRRHHGSGTTPRSSSYAVVVGGAAAGAAAVASGGDLRKKAPESDATNELMGRSAAAETIALPAVKPSTARDGSKAKRKDAIGESKSGSKPASSRKNAVKGAVDKSSASSSTTSTTSAAPSRRQVYREKHKVSTKDTEEKAAVEGSRPGSLVAVSPHVKLYFAKETVKPVTEEPKPEAKSRRRRQRDTKELKQSDSMSPSKSTSETVEETPDASSPALHSETSLETSEPAADVETVTTSFADVVTSSKKPQKATKKEASADTPSEQSTSTTPATSKIEASEVTSMAAEKMPVDDSQSQNLALDAPSASPSESAETKEASPKTSPTQEAGTAADEETTEQQEESTNAVSNDGSSSDIDKAQLSTDDEYEVASRQQNDAAASADESPPSKPAAHNDDMISAREAKRTDKASKKSAAKEKDHRKEKQKKEKTDRKKWSKNKKDKRTPPTSGSSSNNAGVAPPDDPLATLTSELDASNMPSMSSRALAAVKTAAVWAGSTAVAAIVTALALWKQFVERANLKNGLATAFSYVESVLAVVFSVVLLLALHGASWFIRVHRVAFRALLSHRHIGFCFAFLYGFPALVQHIFPWAPPWAPVCLWYAFLVQLFCTNGPTAMMTTFRIILPLVFLVEGISHHSFLLDLNGAELLLTSFILSALKTSNLCSPIFFLSLAAQCLLAVFLGSELIIQWIQLAVALYSLHLMASTEEWVGLGDDDDDLAYHQQQQQHPSSGHHSIADYNHHPAPSAVSIQKTKRLDRRALAYVRGRKLR